jgi:hypothetical protein
VIWSIIELYTLGINASLIVLYSTSLAQYSNYFTANDPLDDPLDDKLRMPYIYRHVTKHFSKKTILLVFGETQ